VAHKLLPSTSRKVARRMNHKIELKGFEEKPLPERRAVQRLIDNHVKRLNRRVKRSSPDVVFLRVVVEDNPAHSLEHVSVKLVLPEKTLAAKEESRDVTAAIKSAFEEIERQLEAYKATQRGEPEWKRIARREELRRMKIGALADQDSDTKPFFVIVSPYLDELAQFAHHAVAYAEARGDLVQGEATAEELVDATLIQAYREFAKDPGRGKIGSWLIDIFAKQLEAEIKRSRSERETTAHIEERVPETLPTEEVSTLGDEILDFYQPDVALKLEDVIPDLEVPTPEQEAQTEELRECVRASLNDMPTLWRRVLLLRYGEELTGAELAKAASVSGAEGERILGYAQEHLRRKLIEAGCSFNGEAGRKSSKAGAGAVTKEHTG
jgi:RNA polymerase sigma factor (sigma-70 family)